MQISKSDYLLYLKHPAWLWLKKHDKTKLPPVDDNTQAIFDAGHMFESYAEQLFPGGVTLGFDGYDEYLSLPARTTEALDYGAKTIFQGRFEHDQLTFICDVINVVGDKEVDLYEIKSSTKAKPEHIPDLAFQMVVLETCGYTVRNISVIHVNNQFVREGEIDSNKLTATTDVTEAVKAKRDQTLQNIDAALALLNSGTHPSLSPSLASADGFNEWLEIYKLLTDVGSDDIYNLCGLKPSLVEIFEQNHIETISGIPEDFDLLPKQELQVESTRLGRPIISVDKIKEYLNTFTYPLYFLDYETFASIVPYFDGLKPYQQVPFQYSLHMIDSPDGELQHMDYLHRDNSNPTEPLSETLQSQIGAKGTVVTWNMGFEKSCNSLMGRLAPEYYTFYEQLNERIVDLMLPFSRSWYVDKGFCGSASIKHVLPVLVPELSYKALDIQEGGSAQRLWMEAVLDNKRDIEKENILDNLVEYCGLDTMAMVKIYDYLSSL